MHKKDATLHVLLFLKWNRRRIIGGIGACLFFFLTVTSSASVYTWDMSTTSGIQTGTGYWGSGYYNWTLDGTTLITWPGAGNSALFAGKDTSATYGWFINLLAIQSIDSVSFVNNGYWLGTWSGGGLNFGSKSGIYVESGKTAVIATAILGTAGITKTGDGILCLSGSNTYTGSTVINEGTIYLGIGGTTGSVAGDIVNNAALIFNRSDTSTFSGIVSGTGNIEKQGAGTLILSGTTTCTGGIEVNSGTLLINGSTALGCTLSVIAGATLGGNGTIGGSLTIGGVLAPGANDVGTLVIDTNITFLGTGNFSTALNGTVAGTGYDQVVMNKGILTLADATLTLTLGFAPDSGQSFTIINNAGSNAINGIFGGYTEGDTVNAFYNNGIYKFTISYYGGTGNDVVLTARGVSMVYMWDISTTAGFQPGNGTWGINSYWTTDGITLIAWPGSGTTAVFPGYYGYSYSISVSGTQMADSIAFLSSYYTLYSGTLELGGSSAIYVDTLQSVTIMSVIDGNAGLAKSGAGTLILTGSNFYAGMTAITRGELQIGNNSTTGNLSADGTVDNRGTLTFKRYDSLVVPNSITGTGAVNQAGSGTLVFTGNATYTGKTTISSGKLQLGNGGTSGSLSGVSNVVNNAGLVFSRRDTVVIANTMSGSGTISMQGTGRVTLTGVVSSTGSTMINSGTMDVNGTLSSSAVTVAAGATFGGTGTIGGTVTVNGQLSPGLDDPGNLTLGNSCTFSSDGALEVSINGTGAGTGYDQITLTGSATLGSAALSIKLGYAPAVGETFTIINNDGVDAISGTFVGCAEGDTIAASFGGYGYLFTVSYTGGTGNDVVLTMRQITVPENYGTWNYSKTVVLNTSVTGANVTQNVYRFPVLIRLNPGNFPFFAQTLNGGADIRFAKNSGEHLSYQIERWTDNAGDNDTAEIWVSVDTVYGNSATQSFKMLWGNSSAVDSSNGAAVFATKNGHLGAWHLGGNLTDATGNKITGTNYGSVDTVSGIIGRARAFNGSSQYFSVGDIVDRPSGSVSFWFRPKTSFGTSSTSSQGIYGKYVDVNTNMTVSLRGTEMAGGSGSSGAIMTKIDNNATSNYNATSTVSWTAGSWYLVVWTWKNGSDTLYVNGIPEGVTTNTIAITGAVNDEVGRSAYDVDTQQISGYRYFNGTIDEFRLDKTQRGSGWAKLSYENQQTNQTLVEQPTHLFWDIASASGIQAGNGIWGTDYYWTSEGTVLAAWPGIGYTATFGGSDGSYTVTVNGTQQVDSVTFLVSGYTIESGTALDFGTMNGINVASGKNAVIATPITGSGGLTLSGGGTLTLTGTNVYTNTTTISNGSLIIDGSLAAGSAVTVSNGTTLGGSGTISGSVSCDGSIAPGTGGAGTLTVGTLSLGSGSVLEYEIGTASDTVAVNGDLVLDGTLNITAASGYAAGTYLLMTYTGTLTDNVLVTGSVPGGYTYSISASGGTVQLTVTTIPAREWIGGGGNNLWSTPGNWVGSIVPTSTDSVVFMSTSYPCSLDVDVAIRCLMFTSGFTQNFYTNGKTVTIGKLLDINVAGSMICNGSDTIRFEGSENKEFRPQANIVFPTIHQAGPGSTEITLNGLTTTNLLVTGGTLFLGSGMADTVSGIVQVNGGTVDFGSSVLSAFGDVDLGNAAGLAHTDGYLNLCASGSQILYPAYELLHPKITHSGNSTLTIRKNRLRTGILTITAGTVVADTAIYADTVLIGAGTMLQLDTVATNRDTINVLQVNGSLNSGNGEMYTKGELALYYASSYGGDGRITFYNTDSVTFMPYPGFVHQHIGKRGAGKVHVAVNSLITRNLTLYDGVWQWGITNDSIIDTLTIDGGTMKLLYSAVSVNEVTGSSGSLYYNTGMLRCNGSGGTVDFRGLTTLSPDSGAILFSGNGSSRFLFAPGANMYPPITISGTSGDTVRLTDSLNARSLSLSSSVLEWGDGFTHRIDTLRGYSGSMYFGSSSIEITTGEVMLSGLSYCSAGSGKLHFSGTSGTQMLTPPPSGDTLPAIEKSGNGILQLSTSMLKCHGLTVQGGEINFSGLNALIDGNWTVTSGTNSTITGLNGVSITVTGDASLHGQSGDLLDCNPSTAWQIAVAGALTASYAVIGKCDASGNASQGVASSTCIDSLNNTNWYFEPLDSDPPSDGTVSITDNAGYTNKSQPVAVIYANGADSMRLGIAADTASSAWKFYATSDSIDLSGGGEGMKYVFVQFMDLAGNRSDWIVDSTMYDITSPAGGITIIDKNGYTNDDDPELNLIGSVDDSIRLGTAADTASATWKQFSLFDSISIADGGDGLKYVFIQFKDRAGNRSTWISDYTMYDITVPAGSLTITDTYGYTNDSDPLLLVTGDSGDSIRLGSAADTASLVWNVFTSSDSIDLSGGGEGMKYVFVQFMDLAGNRSEWIADSTVYDITAPVGSISIVDNGGYTNDGDPTCTLTGDSNDSIRLGSAADTASLVWNVFTSSDSVDLSGGGEGMKYVFFQLRDLAGNRSDWMLDSTIYDITAPTAGIAIIDNNGFTGDVDPAVDLTGDITDSMRLGSVADTASLVWKPFASRDSVVLTGGNGVLHYIFVQLKDRAGNRSLWVADSTVYDTTIPTGGVEIVNNTGATKDSIAVLALTGSTGDSIRIGIDTDTASAIWKIFVSNDSIDLSGGGNGMKHVYVQFKSVSGIVSQWYVDSTVYDTQPPNTVIDVVAQYTYATWPGFISGTVTDAASGPERITIIIQKEGEQLYWNGVSWQGSATDTTVTTSGSWNIDIPLVMMTDGNYQVTAQARDNAGNVESSVVESLFVYYQKPAAAFTADPQSGYLPLMVTFSDSSEGTVATRRWAFGDGQEDTGMTVQHTYTMAGTYLITLVVQGPGGSDSIQSSAVTVLDTTPPLPITGLTAIALNCSTAVLNWNASTSIDGDSISINIADTGFAATHTDGALVKMIAASAVSDTLSGLPSMGYHAFIQTFVVDKSGNWSSKDISGACTLQLPDCQEPDYTLSVSGMSVGDTAIQVSLDADSLAEWPYTISIGSGLTPEEAVAAAREMIYRDTTLMIDSLPTPGWYYIATAVADTVGNRSEFHVDSVLLHNTPPVVSVDADTVIMEDTAWTAVVTIKDINKDSTWIELVARPDSARIEGRQLYWTPDDRDIGIQRFIFRAEDSRGGVTIDTLVITVYNREEPPVVSYEGDTITDEDTIWRMILKADDPDPDDHPVLTIETMPSWVKRSGDTLYGTPEDKDVGSDTLRCSATDSSGLRDTLQVLLIVNNRNDPPVIQEHTFPDSMYEKGIASVTITVADPDRNDTLQLSWEPHVSWIVVSEIKNDTAARLHSVLLLVQPQQRDTGSHTFTLQVSDREGASASFTHTITVIDANDPPQPPSLSRQTAWGAVRYKVFSVDDYDSLLTYAVSLLSLTDTTRVWRDTSSEGVFRFYPLDDGSYKLKATAWDRAQLETVPVYDTLTITGASRMVTGDTAWEMVSVPGVVDAGQLRHSRYLLHWDESTVEQQIYHYYQRKEEIDTIEPGKGYWRKGSAKDTVTVSHYEKTNSPVTVMLHHKDQGWNQIASPYPYPVTWRYNTQTLWKWNAAKRDFEECDSVLEPWVGYWVQSDSMHTVKIDPAPHFVSTNLAKKKRVWFASEHNWTFKIVLTSEKGNDAENRFGIRPDAENGFDQLERLEPPRITEGSSLYFPRDGWKKGLSRYATDLRKKWETINIFEFAITGSGNDDMVNLSIDGYEKNMPVYLYLMGGDSLQQIQPGATLPLKTKASITYKTLFAVNNPTVIKSLPLAFSMGNPYPNPFCPSTRLQYVLPYRWEKDGKLVTSDYDVSIDIYDLRGRKIRACVTRKMKPGRYEFSWDGKSASGRISASGHYYCRLKADKFESVRKLVMLR